MVDDKDEIELWEEIKGVIEFETIYKELEQREREGPRMKKIPKGVKPLILVAVLIGTALGSYTIGIGTRDIRFVAIEKDSGISIITSDLVELHETMEAEQEAHEEVLDLGIPLVEHGYWLNGIKFRKYTKTSNSVTIIYTYDEKDMVISYLLQGQYGEGSFESQGKFYAMISNDSFGEMEVYILPDGSYYAYANINDFSYSFILPMKWKEAVKFLQALDFPF